MPDNNIKRMGWEPLSDMDGRMNRRQIRYKLMSDGHIRAYQPNTPDKRGVSEGYIHLMCAIAPTITTSHKPMIMICDEELQRRLLNAVLRRTKAFKTASPRRADPHTHR